MLFRSLGAGLLLNRAGRSGSFIWVRGTEIVTFVGRPGLLASVEGSRILTRAGRPGLFASSVKGSWGSWVFPWVGRSGIFNCAVGGRLPTAS